jgi:ubiquinone/menaquinone biosynthesis methyltransferase
MRRSARKSDRRALTGPPAILEDMAAAEVVGANVFGRIALQYDLLCDLFSFGAHRLWKRRMAALITAQPWSDLLEVAAGPDSIALRVAQVRSTDARRRITISDVCPKMLALAHLRSGPFGSVLAFRELDAENLVSVPEASIDVYCISLALKICDRAKALTEAYRVLRPTGRLVALEASVIPSPRLQQAYLACVSAWITAIGSIATGGDTPVYARLVRAIRDVPPAEALATELVDVGFADVAFERLHLGVAAIYTATKPDVALRADL